MKFSKEIKIAIVFLAALALVIWGINFLKGSDLFSRQRTFYAVYDRIDGLVPSNPVSVNGFRIGQVQNIRFIDDGSWRILVTLSIDNSIPLPANSIATVFSSDLMGSKEIGITLGDSTVYLKSGDTLASEIQASLQEEVNRQVAPLKKKAEDLMLSIDSMVTVVRLILNEEMREGLQTSLTNIRLTLDGLKNTVTNIDTLVSDQRTRMEMIIVNIESITSNLKSNNELISKTMRNIHNISDSLAAVNIASTFHTVNNVLNDVSAITQKIAEGKGSMGLLLDDESLYKRLDASAKDLDLLLQDMRINPSRYIQFSVFGKKPIPYQINQSEDTTKDPK